MSKRSLPLISLLAYAAILFKVMVFKDMPTIRIGYLMLNFGGTREGDPNFIPFRTIWPYLRGDGGVIIGGINLLGNIGLLVPIGFLLPFLFTQMNWKKALVWAIGSGLVIEGLQVMLHVGIFDIDDVILNGLGVMLGYWMQGLFVRLFPTMRSRAFALLILALLMIAAVFIIARMLQGGREPHRPRPDVLVDRPDSSIQGAKGTATLPDPCRGTGGTGQIIKVGQQDITIRRKDGVEQVIHLTTSTKIRSASGAATMADLRTGAGVTIVTTDASGGELTAMAVLICGGN